MGETDLLGKNGLLTALLKKFLLESLDCELDEYIDDTRKKGNCKNGKGTKTVKTDIGPTEIHTPRDRTGSSFLRLVPKRSR